MPPICITKNLTRKIYLLACGSAMKAGDTPKYLVLGALPRQGNRELPCTHAPKQSDTPKYLVLGALPRQGNRELPCTHVPKQGDTPKYLVLGALPLTTPAEGKPPAPPDLAEG